MCFWYLSDWGRNFLDIRLHYVRADRSAFRPNRRILLHEGTGDLGVCTVGATFYVRHRCDAAANGVILEATLALQKE